MSDTIYALATARGKAGVAIVRVSGSRAEEAAASLGVTGLRPRQAALRRLVAGDSVIDTGLVLLFDAGASFTGEKIVEFQIHGGEAVVAALLSHLGTLTGCRPAKAGEFTRRALENGMLDLTQVEALADLIDAETEAQRRQAERVLSGAIGKKAAIWRKQLIRAGALIEATIDFADEDIPENVIPEVRGIVDHLAGAFQDELDGSQATERIRAGFEVAIIGAPNAGKSSLLNALVGREAAITSSRPGTTRDIIEVRMDIAGLPVTLIDTAGIREAEDEVERMGVERALQRAKLADLRILLLAPGETAGEIEIEESDLVVWSKADLATRPDAISSVTGVGLDALLEKIGVKLRARVSGSGLLIRDRHRTALAAARESMVSAQRWLYDDGVGLELAAADIRAAGHALDLLVGKIGVETLLDEIFSSFCIGK